VARTKPQEIIRRAQVPQRLAERPVLAVQADQASSAGAGVLSRTAAAVLTRVSDSVNSQMISNSREQYTAAATQRMQEDAEGTPRQAEDFVAQQSESWRRGYLKADGIIRVRDWQIEAAKEIAKAEPGTDIEPLIKERMAALTQNPEFQDPQVRKALMPVAMRAAQQVRQQWQADSMREMLVRQKESLTAIIRDGIKGGTFLTSEGMNGLYAMLDQEEYAYLNKRDVDELYVEAAKEELAAGNRDPQSILAFLEKDRGDGQPGLMNTEHGDELRAAAAAGARVIAHREDEARKQAMAEAEWTLQGLADRGQLTHKTIDTWASKFGLSGGDLQSFKRYWNNQQEQTLRRWEQEAKERAREERIRKLVAGATLRDQRRRPQEAGR
jgi:predicted ArsR family transcriptional regulator